MNPANIPRHLLVKHFAYNTSFLTMLMKETVKIKKNFPQMLNIYMSIKMADRQHSKHIYTEKQLPWQRPWILYLTLQFSPTQKLYNDENF